MILPLVIGAFLIIGIRDTLDNGQTLYGYFNITMDDYFALPEDVNDILSSIVKQRAVDGSTAKDWNGKKNWTEIQFFQIESFADNFIFIDSRN